jgi:hypothetical protein
MHDRRGGRKAVFADRLQEELARAGVGGTQGNRIKSPLGLFGRAVDFVKGATNDTPQVEIQPRR